MNTTGNYVTPRMRRIERIHFVGIGGTGMCGIAEVLHNEGYTVSGSDVSESRSVAHLRALGMTVFIGHDSAHVADADVVVQSTAVSVGNPEIAAARAANIPVIPRAAMLAELMRFRHGIAVAGTHGKTTTTSLVASLLAEGGLDPSFVIGGKLNSCGTNAQLGKSPWIVAEADESDASFLFLKPLMAIVTNIDADHMATYGDDFDRLRNTFLEFLHHLPFYGLAVVCVEDEEICRILPSIARPVSTYGFREDASYRVLSWTQTGLVSEFVVARPAPHANLTIRFPWPGRHNVLNAVAAIAIATEVGVDDQAIMRGLANFQGVGRRFQILGERTFTHGTALLVDDYGHHPKEIASTIDAFRRAWPDRRLVHVFQPHRYSRTQALFAPFAQALGLADTLLLLDIYSAGESPMEGVTSDALAARIAANGTPVQRVSEQNLEAALDIVVRDGDVILLQGAGNVGQMALNLMQMHKETAA